jgi:hypothetical protein
MSGPPRWNGTNCHAARSSLRPACGGMRSLRRTDRKPRSPRLAPQARCRMATRCRQAAPAKHRLTRCAAGRRQPTTQAAVIHTPTSTRQHPNRNIGPGWQQTGPRPRTQPVTNRAHAAASPPRRAHQLDARRTNRHSSERCAAQSVVEYGLGPSYKLRVREFAPAFPISRNRVCSLRQFLAVVALPLWHQPCAFPGFGEARTPFLQSVAPKGPHGLCGRRCQ